MTLIGANGVGKTSFLDVFSLLAASAAGKLNKTISDMGGVAANLSREKSHELAFNLEMDVSEQEPLVYDLHIAPQTHTYSICSESLTQRRTDDPKPFKYIESAHSDIRYFDVDQKKLVRPTWDHNSLETSLSQVPRMFKKSEEFRRALSSASCFHALDVSPRAPVKLPQPVKPAQFPGSNGEEMVSLLYTLRESQHARYETVIDTLRAAFPGFEGLNFPPSAAGMISMTWKDQSCSSPFYVHELSEGTLRFLWITAMLQSPELPTIIMFDEPEISLHPEMLGLLADLLREGAQRSQIIVATHSDRLVRFLKPEEVVVLDAQEDGTTSATWADALDLDKWLADYSLDEIWNMGRLGGRACGSL